MTRINMGTGKHTAEKKPMESIRGLILFADQVYPTLGGKWIIAGTYSNWFTTEPQLRFVGGVSVYLRIQFEHAGNYRIRLLLVDRAAPPTLPALTELTIDAVVTDPADPIDCGLKLPDFEVKCPVGSTDNIPIGQPLGLVLTLCMEVNGAAVASAPFRIIFRNPMEPLNVLLPPAPNPDSPQGGQS